MTTDDIRDARRELGRRWGLDRPLSLSEMARILRLSNGASVRDIERGHTPISGPVSALIETYLAGAMPPDGLPFTFTFGG